MNARLGKLVYILFFHINKNKYLQFQSQSVGTKFNFIVNLNFTVSAIFTIQEAIHMHCILIIQFSIISAVKPDGKLSGTEILCYKVSHTAKRNDHINRFVFGKLGR